MDKSCNRQLGAWVFCAWLVPAILLLPQLGWLWATLASAVSGLLLWLLSHRAVRLTDAVPERFLLAVLWIWNLIMLGKAVVWINMVFPTAKDTPLIGLLVFVTAAYAAGRNRAAQVVSVTFFFQAALYGVICGFALPQAKLSPPELQVDWRLLPMALLPLPAVLLQREDAGRGRVGWLLGGIALAGISAFLCAGKPDEPFRFYNMTKSLSLFDTMERFEPLVSASLTAAGFALFSYLCAVNGKIQARMFPECGGTTLVNLLLGGGAYFLAVKLPLTFLAVGTVICWGVVPIFLWLMGEKNG